MKEIKIETLLNKVKRKVKLKKYLFTKRLKIRIYSIKDFLNSKNKIRKIKYIISKKIRNISNSYRNSDNHLAFILNFILSSRIGIILLIGILMLKAMLFYVNIDLSEDSIEITKLMSIIFILIMICPLFFIKKDKNRFWGIMIYNIFFSILLFADNIYFAYSANILSISQILYVKYAEEIRRNITDFIEYNTFILFCRYNYIAYSLEYCKEAYCK